MKKSPFSSVEEFEAAVFEEALNNIATINWPPAKQADLYTERPVRRLTAKSLNCPRGMATRFEGLVYIQREAIKAAAHKLLADDQNERAQMLGMGLHILAYFHAHVWRNGRRRKDPRLHSFSNFLVWFIVQPEAPFSNPLPIMELYAADEEDDDPRDIAQAPSTHFDKQLPNEPSHKSVQ